jgi:type IV secretory pathway TrbD component
MRMNMGGADRTIRVVAGLAIIAAGVFYRSWWGALGVVLLATSAIGWCPLYLPFGLSTIGRGRGAKS